MQMVYKGRQSVNFGARYGCKGREDIYQMKPPDCLQDVISAAGVVVEVMVKLMAC
jgi:hypothetical protein